MTMIEEYSGGYIKSDMSEEELVEFLTKFLRHEVTFPFTSEEQLEDFWNMWLEDALIVRYGADYNDEDYYEFQEKLREDANFMEATHEFTKRTRLEIHI